MRDASLKEKGGVADESAATPPVSKLVQQNCLEIGKQGEVWRGTPLHDRSAGLFFAGSRRGDERRLRRKKRIESVVSKRVIKRSADHDYCEPDRSKRTRARHFRVG